MDRDDTPADQVSERAPGAQLSDTSGECKWTSKPLSVSILASLDDYKIPALRQGGVNVAADPEIILFCRAGFTAGLTDIVASSPNLTLVGVPELVAGL